MQTQEISEVKNIQAGSFKQNGCVLAGSELFVRGTDLSP